ncbi:YhcH/YjgK/YiaL family protein [Paenibacillus sp. CMAA1364]
MIIDRLSNAKLYTGIHPRMAIGLKYLMETDFHSLVPGHYEIEGSNVFAMVKEYETLPLHECRFESHHKYTDIQYMVTGKECMGYANIGNMHRVEEDEEQDIMFYEGTGDIFKLHEGAFCIVTPEDAHMPLLMMDKPLKVKKVVVKVLLEEKN